MTGVPTDTSFRYLSTKNSFREVPFSDGENNIRVALAELLANMSDEERASYPIDEDTFLPMYRSYLRKADQVLHWSDITQPEDLVS